jgi:hypothetical protein
MILAIVGKLQFIRRFPMNKKYIVRLSDEERRICEGIIKALKGSSQKFRRAQILLKADADGPGWSDAKIAEAFNCRVQTIEHLRKRLVTESFERVWTARTARTRPRLASSMARAKRS